MEHTTRTVRFKREEIKLIDRFLSQNPLFDFSSLARIAIEQFIHDPKLHVKPVRIKTKKSWSTKNGPISNHP